MSFFGLLKSESIKRKGSALNWLITGGSFFIPAVVLFSRLFKHQQTCMQNASAGVWMKLFHQNWQFMSVFLLPLGIALAASLLNQLEYRNNTWKQLFTLPVDFDGIFWAKYFSFIFLMLKFLVIFTIGIYLTGFIPAIVYSDVVYPNEDFPWNEYLFKSLEYLVDALPVVALQFLLAFHIRNYMVAIGISFLLLILSIIALSWEYGYILPYSYGSLEYLKADNKIDPTVNLQKWAFMYFILFTAINYVCFILRFQLSVSQLKKGVAKRAGWKLGVTIFISIVTLSVLTCWDLFFSGRSKTKELSVADRISAVERNLGAFILTGNSDWTMESRMKYHKVPGLSIAVVNNFQLEWAKGYGFADVKNKVLIDTATMFIPGSLSKSVNALGVLKLAQNNKLDLFKDINTYLTSWQFPYNDKAKGKIINTAHLLSHTGGTSVSGFMGYTPFDTMPTVVQILNGQSPANSEAVRSVIEPGKEMRYSGGGVLISQLLVSDIAGLSFEEYLSSAVLKPLGMVNSTFKQYKLGMEHKKLATGYDTLENEIKGRYPILPEQAAAGLWTTPSDMCRFIIEIQKSLKGESNKVLNKKFTEMMLTPYLSDESALGFFIKQSGGYTYFGHDAGNRGFSGMFYGSMEKGYGVAIFINSENSDLLREVLNSVIDVYHWPGFERKKWVKEVDAINPIAQKMVGLYRLEGEDKKKTEVRIYKHGRHLFYCLGKQEMKMYFVSSNRFINMENPSEKEIRLNKEGNVVGLIVKKNSQLFYLRKVE